MKGWRKENAENSMVYLRDDVSTATVEEIVKAAKGIV